MKPASRVRWREVAEELGRAIPRDALHPAVVKWAEHGRRRTWGIAFSGGADSVALLLLVWAHWPAMRKRLHALHFNHRLRGRASDADERFCRAVCRSLGVRFTCGKWKQARADASEAEAREARLAFFDAHVRCVWSGHQLDDVAETMLMRLSRGSGVGGLAAPRPVQSWRKGGVRLRPLLTLERDFLREKLEAAGACWREDASNAQANFLRNRVRAEVLENWKQVTRDRSLLRGVARSRELLEEDGVALDIWAQRVTRVGVKGELDLQPLLALPTAIQRRALHLWLAHHRIAGLSSQAFDSLLRDLVARRVTKHSVGDGKLASIGATELRIAAATARK